MDEPFDIRVQLSRSDGRTGSIMRQIMVVALSFSGGIIGCKTNPPDPPLKLTPEEARDAIIKLIRAKSFEGLEKFPIDEFATKPPRKNQAPGSYTWTYFHFDLRTGDYDYTVSKSGDGKNRPHSYVDYRGGFQLENGNWVATKPKVTIIPDP